MSPLRWFTVIALALSVSLEGHGQSMRPVAAHGSAETSMMETYGRFVTPQNEIVPERSLTSRHYRIDDRTRLAFLYSAPVFYLDTQSNLQPISNTIVRCGDKVNTGYPFRNEANDVLFYFSEDGVRCKIVDARGYEIAVLSAPTAQRPGTVSVVENTVVKAFDEDSSVFVWTVQATGLSWRLFFNRKVDTGNIEGVVLADESLPAPAEGNAKGEWKGGKLCVSIITPVRSPESRLRFSTMAIMTDTTSTLLGTISVVATTTGQIYRSSPSATPVAGGPHIHIQNLSDPGCSYGFRSWAKYDLARLSGATAVSSVEQHMYARYVSWRLFDLLDMNVTRLSADPTTTSALLTWNAIQYGTTYIDDRGLMGTGWYTLAMPDARMDVLRAISSPGWFALGFMVWCDEDTPEFYASFDGAGEPNPPYLTVVYTTLTDASDMAGTPSQYMLAQNFPNPFNPSTTFRYDVPSAGRITLKVYDVLGREVATLVDEVKLPGRYEMSWNAEHIPSGVYFYRLTAGAFTETKRMALAK